MNHLFNAVLVDIERDLDTAHGKAASLLVRVFRYELGPHCRRHQLKIQDHHGNVCLHVDGQPWFAGNLARNRHDFPIVKLLDDIDATLEKCDNAVKRHITGVIL